MAVVRTTVSSLINQHSPTMHRATAFVVLLLLFGSVTDLLAQEMGKLDLAWKPDQSLHAPSDLIPGSEPIYNPGSQNGARGISGPHDMDGDGKIEIIVTDYSGGGRAHVLEVVDVNTWELVYSTPWADSTANTQNARIATASDLDGDGMGEIIFLAGRGYSATNPFLIYLPAGLYVVEATGDNIYAPVSRYTFDDDFPDRWRSDVITVMDVDNDGSDEVMFPNNGSNNRYDNWYVLSVVGDLDPTLFLTGGLEVWVTEARWSSRATEDFDPVNRGGGSAQAIIPADLDGDGMMELAMHSWNHFNFTNARVTGPNMYEAPGASDTLAFLNATPGASTEDHVSLFGCTATDMDGNGDDEVYCPRLGVGDVSLLNYEAGENPLQISEDNFILGVIPGLTTLGITSGDIDKDGNMELIGAGAGYTAGSFSAGRPPIWIRIADYISGDVEDPANYSVREIAFPEDMVNSFNTVVRDSAGTITEYLETPGGSEFPAKLAYLGDPDNDGFNEVAISMQGVDDSLYVFDEVYNPADSTYTRTVRESMANENRVFLRVLSSDGLTTDITKERIVVPNDYVLSANYPNPFNPSTTFSFTLPLDKQISLRVYDITGRLVHTLIDNQWYSAGTHEATWSGINNAGLPVASGTYIYTLQFGNFQHSRTMLLIK